MEQLQRPDHRALTRLDGRAVVILGCGGGGMGTATALMLAEAGAKLLCVDIDPAQARDTADQTGGEPYVADICDRAQMEKLFARAEDLFGDGFHGVVDIVGASIGGPIPSFDDATIEKMFTLNLRHAVLTTQIAGPMLAKRGRGSMAFISSLASLAVAPNQPMYSVAKAALNHLVRCAAFEYGPYGVRSNAVATAINLTPGVKAHVTADEIDAMAQLSPMKRVGVPQDMANTLFYLISDLSSYINGSIIALDGGIMIDAHLPRLDRTAQTQQA